MAGFGCRLMVLGLVMALAPGVYVALTAPDMTRLKTARQFWPIAVPGVALAVVGVLLFRRPAA